MYDAKNEVFALLIFGVWDWEAKSDFSDAGLLLQTFVGRVPKDNWAFQYKPLAGKYLADWKILEPLEKGIGKLDSPAAATAFLNQIKSARSQIQTGTKISERLDALEKTAKAAKP